MHTLACSWLCAQCSPFVEYVAATSEQWWIGIHEKSLRSKVVFQHHNLTSNLYLSLYISVYVNQALVAMIARRLIDCIFFLLISDRFHSSCSSLARVVNRAADGGITSLHMAALNSHTECVHLLLDLSANVNSVTIQDGTTIDLIGILPPEAMMLIGI